SLEVIDRWRHYPALRTSRAVGIFKRLQPSILARIARAAHPDEALIQFDGFLSGLPAGVQLFSMFDSNPQLIDLLVDICGSAPGLARYLSRNSQVFDAVIAGTFFEVLPAMDDLAAELAAVLTPLDDYENQLNAARRWMKELHFRIGVQHLKGMIQSETAG
ncbi:MAG TPA: glutamine-synthetase adenylyltransferase, partial [Rhodobacteraceae bacterium]|nr:glutamine-synthetase adenylyltransferase [Paracoccaceae bacterium]